MRGDMPSPARRPHYQSVAINSQYPKMLRDLLGAIRDAVSRELDDGQVSTEIDAELEMMETHLAQSVHVLRL